MMTRRYVVRGFDEKSLLSLATSAKTIMYGFAMLAITGCSSEPEQPPDALECDIPRLFEDRCGGSICHGAGESTAADLDLTSPGVEGRVSGVPGGSCAGILADSADPVGSLLYQKVEHAPTCGARMPINGDPLTEDEMTCLRDWISGLLPPTGGDGGDGSDTCPECECAPDEVEVCYSGFPETEGVGVCMAGQRTCAPSGSSWGVCEGEVIPRGENCLTDLDEDCDGQTPPCSEQWSRGFGDELSQSMRSVAVDSQGNVYSTGDFQGVVSFGGEPLVAVEDKADIVLAKHDMYGNPVWAKHFGDSSNQYAAKLIVDSKDNLILLGRVYGYTDLGGGPLKARGSGDILLGKFDGDGNHLWSRIYGDKDPDRAERIVVDSEDNIIITGTFTTLVDFGSGPFTTAGMRDAFVLKLDGATGAHLFSRQIGGPGDDYGFGVGVDANDNVIVAGRFEQSLELAGDLSSAGGTDIYLAKLSPAGVPVWSERLGGTGDAGVHDLVVHPQTGDIVMVGHMSKTVDFGGGDRVSAGARDIFVVKLDGDGDHVWSAVYGDASDQFASTNETNEWLTLAIGPTGLIHFGGGLLGELDFGGVSLASAGDKPDVFYVKLGLDGSFAGGNRYGGTSTDFAFDLAVASSGHIVMAGRTFGSTLDFGPSGSIIGRGHSDGFIVKLP